MIDVNEIKVQKNGVDISGDVNIDHKSKEDQVVSDITISPRSTPLEPTTPKGRIFNTLSKNLGYNNSVLLTPSRKAAIEAKSVSKYRSEIEDALNKNVHPFANNKYDEKMESNEISLSPSTRRGSLLPATLGIPVTMNENYKFLESPLLSEPRTPNSRYRNKATTNRSIKTPYSDPKSVTDVFYSSVHNYSAKSDSLDNALPSNLELCAGDINSAVCSSPNKPINSKRYYKKLPRKSNRKERFKIFNSFQGDYRISLSDINSIPRTLVSPPFSKTVLLARQTGAKLLTAFPQLIEVNDAPPAPCYEDHLAKKEMSSRRSYFFTDNIKSKIRRFSPYKKSRSSSVLTS